MVNALNALNIKKSVNTYTLTIKAIHNVFNSLFIERLFTLLIREKRFNLLV